MKRALALALCLALGSGCSFVVHEKTSRLVPLPPPVPAVAPAEGLTPSGMGTAIVAVLRLIVQTDRPLLTAVEAHKAMQHPFEYETTTTWFSFKTGRRTDQ